MSGLCSEKGSNLGAPDCDSVMDVTKKIVLVHTRDSVGNFNSIDPTVTLDEAFFTARVNDPDKTKRWFVTELVDNVIDERGEATVFALDSGKELFRKNGERAIACIFAESGNEPVYEGKLQDFRCLTMSAFLLDKSGNIVGNGVIEDGVLRPFRLAKNSIVTGLTKAQESGGNSQFVAFKVTYSSLEQDKEIRHIQASDIDASVCEIEGLKDVNVAISTTTPPTTTTFQAALTLDFGFGLSAIVVEGLLTADFTLAEKSPTPGAIVITSATETGVGTGIYDFIIPTQTSGDVLELTVITDGFESKSNVITIP